MRFTPSWRIGANEALQKKSGTHTLMVFPNEIFVRHKAIRASDQADLDNVPANSLSECHGLI